MMMKIVLRNENPQIIIFFLISSNLIELWPEPQQLIIQSLNQKHKKYDCFLKCKKDLLLQKGSFVIIILKFLPLQTTVEIISLK